MLTGKNLIQTELHSEEEGELHLYEEGHPFFDSFEHQFNSNSRTLKETIAKRVLLM